LAPHARPWIVTIETYKLLTGKYDQQVALALPKNVTGKYYTRGNSNKLLVKRSRLELRRNFFSHRVTSHLNKLSEKVVQAETVNTFKNRLDNEWGTLSSC